MNWHKFTLDEWLEQFGAWCDRQGRVTPNRLETNQIYHLMQSVNPTPRRTKYCHISDDEALKVNAVLCEMAVIMPKITDMLLANKVHKFSLREIEKAFGVSHNQAKNLINCGMYYLAGRMQTNP